MIALFTDFGLSGPYVGQMHAVLAAQAPGVPVIDLFHDVPNHDVRAGAYLLPACVRGFPIGSVFVCVVDPGVGTGRAVLALNADHRWYLGPDNGLLQLVARRARSTECYEITWRPRNLSPSFHGRDLFAPAAAMLARGVVPEMISRLSPVGSDWPDDYSAIVFIDRFGNAMTGIRAESVPESATVTIKGHRLKQAATFGSVNSGDVFWYENSQGLVELAVNAGRADQVLGIQVGDAIEIGLS